MSVTPRWPSPANGWPVLTRAGRARLRDQRLDHLRAFARRPGWAVLGLHEDLSVRHPVAPLLGAVSAQAELAVAGPWLHWPAMVASVLVQEPAGRTVPRQRDLVVQLTTLDTGPLRHQFSARATTTGVELELLGRPDSGAADTIRAMLDDARRQGRLRPGDNVAADEVDLLHTRTLGDGRRRLDALGPLEALSALVDRLL